MQGVADAIPYIFVANGSRKWYNFIGIYGGNLWASGSRKLKK